MKARTNSYCESVSYVFVYLYNWNQTQKWFGNKNKVFTCFIIGFGLQSVKITSIKKYINLFIRFLDFFNDLDLVKKN